MSFFWFCSKWVSFDSVLNWCLMVLWCHSVGSGYLSQFYEHFFKKKLVMEPSIFQHFWSEDTKKLWMSFCHTMSSSFVNKYYQNAVFLITRTMSGQSYLSACVFFFFFFIGIKVVKSKRIKILVIKVYFIRCGETTC